MLQVFNFDDQQPNFVRKTSESLALTNLTDIDFIQCYNVLQIDCSSKECRICLQNTEDSKHVFSSPCKCIGSVKFVHQSCFITWLERQYSLKTLKEQKKLMDEGIQCELCKQKIYLNFQTYKRCLNFEEACVRIKKNLKSFILILLLLVISLASLSFIIYFMQDKSMSSFGIQIIATAVLICAFVFLLVAVISVLYSLIANFLIEKKMRLQSFTTFRKMKAKNKKQVIPF